MEFQSTRRPARLKLRKGSTGCELAWMVGEWNHEAAANYCSRYALLAHWQWLLDREKHEAKVGIDLGNL